jgi:hypothetical protein
MGFKGWGSSKNMILKGLREAERGLGRAAANPMDCGRVTGLLNPEGAEERVSGARASWRFSGAARESMGNGSRLIRP